MLSRNIYQQQAMASASAAIAKGPGDLATLRELLIWTTAATTCAMIESYFQQHHHDEKLLEDLFYIAEEGEDAGDAPWAAVNTIADFPAIMLAGYEAQLVELSKHQWMYLSRPALQALAKVRETAT